MTNECKETDNDRVRITLQNMNIHIRVHDSSTIITELNHATSRKYHAHDGDHRITNAIHNYCFHRFPDLHTNQLLDDITNIEHRLRSNALFAEWFDTFHMAHLITNVNLLKQVQSKNCVKCKGTIFEAFLSLLAKDQSTSPRDNQELVEDCITTILNENFDFEEYFRYKNHTYMDTLHLPYKKWHDYKKEFKRLTNKLYRTIPFHSFPIVYDAERELYTLTLGANPLLDQMPEGYKFACSFRKKDECLQYTIYHFLKERAIVDQRRTA